MHPSLGAALQRAVALEAAGKREDAEFILRQIVTLDPDNAEALHLLALLIGHGHRIEEARTLIDRAVAQEPRRALFLRSQSEIFRRLGLYDEAEAVGRAAFALEPGDYVVPTILSAIAYHRLDLAATIRWAEAALERSPDYAEAHFELAKALLLSGAWERGWLEYEYRFSIFGSPPLMPPSPQPQWDGQPLSDTLLLIADQGFGDTIQFMRYIPWAQTLCSDIAIAIDAAIAAPLKRMYPDVRPFTDWQDRPNFAAYCPLSGLPRLHGTRLTSIPTANSYLRPDEVLAASWAAQLRAVCPPGARRIGLAWAGRPTHNDDANRSMSLQTLAPLADIPNIVWVSLQKGEAREKLAEVTWSAPLLDVGHATTSFDDTVAVLAGLDLVLTVDTVIAHLAGALGKPVWVMLPYAPDWRWLLDRTDSPWYPTVRLFRQKAPRDWTCVVAEVGRALS
jgi:hypothetical protein